MPEHVKRIDYPLLNYDVLLTRIMHILRYYATRWGHGFYSKGPVVCVSILRQKKPRASKKKWAKRLALLLKASDVRQFLEYYLISFK